jgi:hypothetical protein
MFIETFYCNTSMVAVPPLSVTLGVSLSLSVWHPMSVRAKSKTDLWYANHNSIIQSGFVIREFWKINLSSSCLSKLFELKLVD